MSWCEIRRLLIAHLKGMGLVHEDAEDGAHDIICRLLINKTEIKGRQYLWIAAKHYAADRWRRKKIVSFRPLIEEVSSINVDTLDQKEALRKLEPRDREFLNDYIMRDYIKGKDRVRAMRIRNKLQEMVV